MKLIDIEQEVYVPVYDEDQGISYEQIMTVENMFKQFLGQMPPLVDAIPVEWLRNIKAHLPQSIDKMGIDAVLMLWSNEQEAHGT